MTIDTQQLKTLLLDTGTLKKEELVKAEAKAAEEKIAFEEVLTREGLVSEDALAQVEAYALGIPFVNLEKETIPPHILKLIPEPIARKSNIIAYRRSKDGLEVAMLDPKDLQTIEFIRKSLNLRILPRLTSGASIKNALKQYQKSLEAEFGELIKGEVRGVTPVEVGEEVQGEDLKKMAEDLPIIRIVDTLLKHAILQNASDIHIEPYEKEVIIRYRIDGILHDAMTLPRQVESGIVARIKVLSSLKLDEHRLPQDGRFKIEVDDYRISFRVSILPVYDGEKVVMRLLKEGAKGYALEELGFIGEGLERIHHALKKANGMILATGPTGSGKTTTLYTMMEILNTADVNISTIEDPIEYRMPRINQTQVKPQIGLTFANGLRSLVRQDPDIIMVGEIRDTETASLAINASLTGHLVLSTLHTNSAAGALPRLIDMQVEPFLIASTVRVIIGQRLVRRLYESKQKHKLTEGELKSLGQVVDLDHILEILKHERIIDKKTTWQDIDFYSSNPTPEFPDGYHDRIGIHEVLEVTESIKELIMHSATSDQLEAQARKEGMISMVEDGIIKCVQGITTLEEVLRETTE